MGGKDVIYMKQHYASSLEPTDVRKRLLEVAEKRFLDSEHVSQNSKVLLLFVVYSLADL